MSDDLMTELAWLDAPDPDYDDPDDLSGEARIIYDLTVENRALKKRLAEIESAAAAPRPEAP
jgi:hypothetical protein